MSSENQGGLKVVSIDRYCFSGGVLEIFLDFKGTPSWILQKLFCRYFEPKLLVMCVKIGEVLKMVCSADQFVKHGISANRSGAR